MNPTAEKTPSTPLLDQPTRFIHYLLDRCRTDKGLAARLKRADNPDTEYQSWELLAAFGIDLEKERIRLPYALVAAGLAKAKAEGPGTLSLGRALALSYKDKNQMDQAKAKLRRLLACQDISELCRILRPLLALIHSKVGQPLDYVALLKQMLRFSRDPQAVKAQWAQAFYSSTLQKEGRL